MQLFFTNISLLSIPDTIPKVKGFCDNFLTLKESETVFPLKISGIYAKKWMINEYKSFSYLKNT